MRRFVPAALLAATMMVQTAHDATAQNTGSLVFLNRRPPREFNGNIRAWASANRVQAVSEDVSSHVWRVQFMAFLSRAPGASEVNLVFYKIDGNTRRYVSNQSVSLNDPSERVFFHQTVLHRGADEFQPMERYEVAVTVADARGNHEIARGRIGLVGQVEHREGVVDFTGAAPVVR